MGRARKAAAAGAVPAKWIRTRADEIAIAEGCTWDPWYGKRVCEFLEGFCRLSKGRWAGELMRLAPWQRDFVLPLYSWRRPDGTRRFRTAYLEVAKKNGKSALFSGLALYHTIADGEPGAEVYLNAYDRAQAGIIFVEAQRMVEADPDLKARLEVYSGATSNSQKVIVDPETNSRLEALSADVQSKHGPNASAVFWDELHTQKTDALWKIFLYAGSARLQPLRLAISTAGTDRQSVCWREHEHTRRVNCGDSEDTTHFGVIYGIDLEADGRDLVDVVKDPAAWAQANPSLGITLSETDFAADAAKALEKPTELEAFAQLRLDIWVAAARRFLKRLEWDRCGQTAIDPAELRGRPCYAGLDLASVRDLAAFVLAWPVGDRVKVWPLFWVPEESARQREETDRVPYLTWARRGLVKLTPGAVVDYKQVRADIVEAVRGHDLKTLLADPYNARATLIALRDEDGLPVEEIRQGFVSLNEPTKELERLVGAGLLEHGAHAVLTWCADNAVAVKDGAGNIKLSKELSREKIDGLAATVDALAGMLAGPVETPSVYETRGLITIPTR